MTVRCPRCETPFVFAPNASDSRSAGPISKPTVSESRVMAILAETDNLPQPPGRDVGGTTHPCGNCERTVDESLSVCPHCNVYLGPLPTFMREL